MNRLILFCLGLVIMVSCNNYKKKAEKLMIEKDSIADESVQKDSSFVEIIVDFNEILTTLDSIKKIEKLITLKSASKSEMSYQQKKMILKDIELLNSLIKKNKNQLARLQEKLTNANSKIGNLSSVLTEFEQLAKILDKQIKEKDTEIVELATEVQKLTKNIAVLNKKIALIETESEEKTLTIEQQELELNKAYFVYGSLQELRDSGVVERSGGIIGLGSSNTIVEDFNREYFTEVDIRNFDFIPLMVKKADLASVHPSGSFRISGEKTADTLFIDNKTEFWRATKYLVIVTK